MVGAMVRPRRSRGMLVTDLDGTLLGSSRTLHPLDRAALEELDRRDVVRVVATGRNPLSYLRAVGYELPVDYVILSSGVAVMDHRRRRYIRISSLQEHEVLEGMRVLAPLDLDFMVHEPAPENHRFAYRRSSRPSEDLARRIQLYAPHARPLEPTGLSGSDGRGQWRGPASQLLAIDPEASGALTYERVRAALPALTVIRATSPLSGQGTWVEIFAPSVSKSKSSAWLAAELGIETSDVLTVGNDYNDLDLLDWGGTSFVVANAPADLKARYPAVPSNDEAGVSVAIRRWLEARGP